MFQAYSVGVTLKLTDLVAPALFKLSRDFARFDTIVARTNAGLRTLGRQATGVKMVAQSVRQMAADAGIAGRQVGALNRHLAGTGRAAGGIAAVGTAASQTGYALHRASQQAALLNRNLLAARATGAAPIVLPGTHVVGRMRQGPLHGGGVSLSTAGVGVGAVGLGAGSQAGMVGAGAAIAGGIGLAAMYKGPLEAAKEGELAAARFRTMGLGAAVNKEAEAFARGANVFGVSAPELLDTAREMTSFFGTFREASQIAPTIAALNRANAGLFGGKIGKLGESETQALIKSADIRGKTGSRDDLLNELNIYQKMFTSSGGAIKPRDIYNFMKFSGVAGKGLSEEGLYEMVSLFQEQGGARTGTATMSLYQNLVSGRATKGAMAVAQELGLGNIVQEKVGALGGKPITQNKLVLDKAFEKRLIENQSAAVREFILPAIERIYGKNGAKVDDRTILKVINSLASNRNAANQGGTFGTQQLQILRDAKFALGSMGIQETTKTYQETFGGAEQNAIARWNDSMRELGRVILPAATEGALGLAGAIQSATDWIKQNKNEAKVLAFALTGLGGAMLFSGSVLLLGSAFRMLGGLLGAGGAVSTGAAVATGALGGPGGLAAALLGISHPIGLAIGSLVALAGAAYAYRPMSQGEVDAVKRDGGARLTPEAAERLRGMGEVPGPKPLPRPRWQFWHPESGLGKLLGTERQGDATAHLRPTQSFYPRREGSPFIAPPADKTVQVTTQINMDSRPIATAVTQHQAESAARFSGPRRFDPTQQLLPPGSITGGR